MATLRAEPALRIHDRFTLSSGEPVFEIATLRRPELVLRFTSGTKIAVDERLLTSLVPEVVERSRLVALVVVAGVLDVEGVGLVKPGESVLVEPVTLARTRSKDAAHVSLAWDSSEVEEAAAPRRMRSPAMAPITTIIDGLLERTSDQRSTLASAFTLFRSLGVPLLHSVDALEGEPTDRDHQFAAAIEAQLENLSSHAHVGA